MCVCMSLMTWVWVCMYDKLGDLGVVCVCV